ncbi:carboxypeptidase-like regulatory domain-containing protein [Jatrophihabitans sp.]|uniref:carboxypeptidase-like regulatory domain-containing protein n=1 Tax=Jatrophihabitans sp. TaxID=1932789 RepID=UPI0030C72C92
MNLSRKIALRTVFVVAPLIVVGLVGPGRAAALPTPLGGISGRVIAVGGTPLAGVRVDFYTTTQSTPELIENTKVATAADGTWSYGKLPAGSYDVCFDPETSSSGSSPDGYAFQCWYNHTEAAYTPISVAGSNPVSVAAGHTTVGIGAALHAAGGFSGVITDSDGNAIPHAVIQIDPSITSITTTATADGRYTIAGLTPGLTVVCANGPATGAGGGPYGWAPKCWRNDLTYYNPVLLTVQPGQITGAINFKLYKNGALAGSVVNASSAPLAGATVTLHPLAIGIDYTFTTSSSGTFGFDDLAPGFYSVCAADGAKSACWKSTVPKSATPIVVPQTVKVQGIAITLR